MSFASLDNLNDKYPNEMDFVTKNVSLANGNKHFTTNGAKHALLEDNRRKSVANFSISTNNGPNGNHLIGYNEDTQKDLHNENGINFSVLNGPFNSNTLNNHQPERSLETSENVFRTNGPSSGASRAQVDSAKQIFRESMDSGTAVSSIMTQHSNDSSSLVGLSQYGRRPSKSVVPSNEQNLSNETLRTISSIDHTALASRDIASNAAGEERKNDRSSGYGARRSENANETNPFFNEKISDIFVNRTIGAPHSKLYHPNGDSGNAHSIYNNKLYNGSINADENKKNKSFDPAANEFGHKAKSFYLHEHSAAANNSSTYGDTKVYNIFSKQPMAQPTIYDNNHNEEENAYLATKLSAKSMPRNQKMQQNWNVFEDEDLKKILG